MKYIQKYNIFESDLKYDLSLKAGDDETQHKVFAKINGKIIGELVFVKSKFKNNLIGSSIVVDPNFQRNGIASALYKYAEQEMGMKFLRNDSVLTGAGKALWDNPKKTFGE